MALPNEESRVRVLEATDLLDTAPERAFDRLTRLAAGLLGAPVALVSLVDERRQFFKSEFGLREPWAGRRETPLSHSFCQYVVRDRAMLAVTDAREHATLRDNPAIRELNVIAYLGVPLLVSDEAVGAFCVIDDKPRVWSEREIAVLTDLAESVVAEIDLRVALRRTAEQRAIAEALFEHLGDAVLAISAEQQLIVANSEARRLFADSARVGAPLPRDLLAAHRSTGVDGAPLRVEDGPLGRAIRGEDTSDLQFSLRPPGMSEEVWVEANGRPVRDAAGKVVAAVAVYRDVTERKRRQDLYAALAGNIPRGAVILFDQELRCLAIDGGLLRTLATTAEEVLGRHLLEIAVLGKGAEGRARLEDALRRTLGGDAVSFDLVQPERTLSLHTAPVHDRATRVRQGLVLALDVTEERATAAALRKSEQVYRALVQNLPNAAVLMVDQELRFRAADGPALADALRHTQVSDVIGRTVDEVALPENREEALAIYRSGLQGEARRTEVRRGDRFYDLHVVPVFEGHAVSHTLLFLYDVTNRKAELSELAKARAALEEHAQKMQEASVTDELTGLINRRGFSLLATQAMNVAIREQHRLVLFFIDMNGMKRINDTLGHKLGDRALIDTAALLRQVFRASDTLARSLGWRRIRRPREGGTRHERGGAQSTFIGDPGDVQRRRRPFRPRAQRGDFMLRSAGSGVSRSASLVGGRPDVRAKGTPASLRGVERAACLVGGTS